MNEWQPRIDSDANWTLIPTHMHEGITAYVEDRRPPGGFLRNLLSNDLKGAALRADDENRAALAEWAMFLYHYVPGNCWGSPERVSEWLTAEQEEQG